MLRERIRRWLGVPQEPRAGWIADEIGEISTEIGALKGALIEAGVRTSEDLDAAMRRQKEACRE